LNTFFRVSFSLLLWTVVALSKLVFDLEELHHHWKPGVFHQQLFVEHKEKKASPDSRFSMIKYIRFEDKLDISGNSIHADETEAEQSDSIGNRL